VKYYKQKLRQMFYLFANLFIVGTTMMMDSYITVSVP